MNLRYFMASAAVALSLSAAPALSHGLGVESAWTGATRVAGENAAVYLTIVNEAFHVQYLLSAAAAVAQRVELHQTGEISVMKRVEKIEIPLSDNLNIRQAGFHIMLIGLKRPLILDEKLPITLKFGDGQVQQSSVTVSDDGPPIPAGKNPHDRARH